MPRLLLFASLALLAGCASGSTMAIGQDFSLTVGQQLTLPDGSALQYAGIANDSRCPPKVQCIRAGDADVLFNHVLQGNSHRVTLNTERMNSARLGAWQLHLIDLTPGTAPRVTARIEAVGTTP